MMKGSKRSSWKTGVLSYCLISAMLISLLPGMGAKASEVGGETHTHIWTYEQYNGDLSQVKATCSSSDETECTYKDGIVLKLEAESPVDWSGDVYSGAVLKAYSLQSTEGSGDEITDIGSLGVNSEIKYYKISSGSEENTTEENSGAASEYGAPKNAGEYRAKVEFVEATAAADFTISKIDLTGISATGETVTYDGKEHSITVTGAPEDATIMYGETEEDYSLPEPPKYTDVGEYKVFYKVESKNHNAFVGSATVVITPAEMEGISATGENVTYDGKEHSITVTGAPEGADIKYGTEENNYTLSEPPKYIDAGEYTVFYQVELKNYKPVVGSATVVITLAEMEGINVTGETVTYDGKEHSITVTGAPEDATIKYGTEEGNYTLSEPPKYIDAGVYNVYYEVTKTNYRNTGSAVVTINPANMAITAKNILREYDGKAYGIEVKGAPAGATIKYGTKEGEYTQDSLTYAAVGTYTVYYKVTAKNYIDFMGFATIQIKNGHSWDAGKITKYPTDSEEGQLTYTCVNDKSHVKQIVLPKKVVSVTLGLSAKIISDTSACQNMTIPNVSKYKKYLTFNGTTGVISTKKYYKTKLKTSIPAQVTVAGKVYPVTIKVKIAAPKVKVIKKKVKIQGQRVYKYIFKYNIKKANKIKVRMLKGGTKAINKEFDRYISKSKSNKDSYILYSKKTLKKLNNQITFKIIAHYGKNKSETLYVTK